MKVYIYAPWEDCNEKTYVQKRQEIMKALEFHFKLKIDFFCYCDIYNGDNKYKKCRSSMDYIKECDRVVFLVSDTGVSHIPKDETAIVENLFPEKIISSDELDKYIADYYRAKCKSLMTVDVSDFKKSLLFASDNASIYVKTNETEFPVKTIVNDSIDKIVIMI